MAHRDQIEELFMEAEKDRSKAFELKRQLDRYGCSKITKTDSWISFVRKRVKVAGLPNARLHLANDTRYASGPRTI